MKDIVLIFVITILAALPAFGDEPILPKKVVLSKGYTPYLQAPKLLAAATGLQFPYKPHSLPWPVTFRNKNNSIGTLMAQLQSYLGWDYFHGGCDLVTMPGEDVRTPISGTVEAGYYMYSKGKNGYLEKEWIPLAESEGKNIVPNYFEVSVIDDYGYRFEFHHIDSSSLPSHILDALKNKSSIEKGMSLGKVLSGNPYDHIHYNIIAPNGIRVNCEWASPILKDQLPPQIVDVFGIDNKDQGTKIKNGESLQVRPLEFAVSVLDTKDNSPYVHQPHFVEIIFESGTRFSWDFRKALVLPNGLLPNIFDFYKKSFAISGMIVSSKGFSNDSLLFVRLPIKFEDYGQFIITVKDAAGNTTQFTGTIPPARI